MVATGIPVRPLLLQLGDGLQRDSLEANRAASRATRGIAL
jgi:hypothetical protein